ncbi:hypothetical protein [Pantoea stewartii]|uniref:hypothetical protein n=1 Tax=Pantoea stewartii TaxID=66269 RepID=UPI0025A2768D|nr:hypothetical protein [Pantoea stewartii]
MRDLTVKLAFKTNRVIFSVWLRNMLSKGDDFPEILAERLEIQADSKAEAVDFVKQVLIDIAAEEMSINADKPGKSFRQKLGGADDN